MIEFLFLKAAEKHVFVIPTCLKVKAKIGFQTSEDSVMIPLSYNEAERQIKNVCFSCIISAKRLVDLPILYRQKC